MQYHNSNKSCYTRVDWNVRWLMLYLLLMTFLTNGIQAQQYQWKYCVDCKKVNDHICSHSWRLSWSAYEIFGWPLSRIAHLKFLGIQTMKRGWVDDNWLKDFINEWNVSFLSYKVLWYWIVVCNLHMKQWYIYIYI